jgi:hypothetical protein
MLFVSWYDTVGYLSTIRSVMNVLMIMIQS